MVAHEPDTDCVDVWELNRTGQERCDVYDGRHEDHCDHASSRTPGCSRRGRECVCMNARHRVRRLLWNHDASAPCPLPMTDTETVSNSFIFFKSRKVLHAVW